MKTKFLLLSLLVGGLAIPSLQAQEKVKVNANLSVGVRYTANPPQVKWNEAKYELQQGVKSWAEIMIFDAPSIPDGKKVEEATLYLVTERNTGNGDTKICTLPYDIKTSMTFDELDALIKANSENVIKSFNPKAEANNKEITNAGTLKDIDNWKNYLSIENEWSQLKTETGQLGILIYSDATNKQQFFTNSVKDTDITAISELVPDVEVLKPYIEFTLVDMAADDPDVEVLDLHLGGYSTMKVTWPNTTSLSFTNNGEISATNADLKEPLNLKQADGVVKLDNNSLVINLLTLPKGKELDVTIPAGYVSVNGKTNGNVTKKVTTPSKSSFSGELADGKIVPVADTYIRTGNKDNNGGKEKMELKKDGDTYFAGLLGFPLSIAADKQVKKATLHLVTERKKNGSGDVKVYPYSNDFEENAIWENEEEYAIAALAQEELATLDLQSQNDKSMADAVNEENQNLSKWTNDIDVTDYVKTVTSSRVNFMIVHENNAQVCFFTKENKGVYNDGGLIQLWATEITADDLVPYLVVELEDKPVTKVQGAVAVSEDNKYLTYTFTGVSELKVNNVAGEISATSEKSYELKAADGVVAVKDNVLSVDLRTLPAGKAYKVNIPEGYLVFGEDQISAAVVDHEVAVPAKTAHSGSLGDNVYLPVQDTFVRETAADKNYGADKKFEVNSGSLVGLLGFEIAVPEGKKAKSATLRLVSERGKDNTNEVEVYGYSHDFNETTATWETESQYVKSSMADEPIVSFVAKGHNARAIYESTLPESHHALDNWVNEVDVTSYVAAHKGGRLNLLLSKEGANQVCFFSKENTGIDNGDNLNLFWTVDVTASDLVPTLTVVWADKDAADDDDEEEEGDNMGSTAIDAFEYDAEAPVEYYDLSGRRVANPDKGIYIMRQGNKTLKVVK